MKNRFVAHMRLGAAAVIMLPLTLVLAGCQMPAAGPGQSGKRTSEGKPDLNGIWQVQNAASWDIQDHNAQKGVHAGQSVVEGNEIPYKPEALAKKAENYK